ncbi:MAG: alpha/beta hydrolase family protein [Gemmatirosa sp.]
MTIDFTRRVLAGVPVLLARRAQHHGPRPVVLWLHGFRAAAEDNRDELARLAGEGFLAVGVDAVGHGARRDERLAVRVAASPAGAVPAIPTLGAAVALLGAPEWPGDDSPHRRPHAFHDVALLSITAERDASVPPDAARRFHATLAVDHPRPDRARHLELPDAEHLMTGAQWHAAMDGMLDWLRAHLR